MIWAKRGLLVLLFGLSGSAPPTEPETFVVHAPAGAAPGLELAVADLRRDLARVTGAPVALLPLPPPACRPGVAALVVLGHEHDESGRPRKSPLAPQRYSLRESRCARAGRNVVLRGGSLLSGQWAVYDLLSRLGIRYFHPEHTLFPPRLAWPAQPINEDRRPAFMRRSMHLHVTHPVELSPPRDPGGLDMAAFQRRWIDWNVKLRQTSVDGWDHALVGNHAYTRGFPRTAELNLLNTQQGGVPLLVPGEPGREQAQIARALHDRMRPLPGQPDASELTVQFNPSEFTEAGARDTVRRLTFITEEMQKHHPGVELYTINHGTAQKPAPPYGVRFFDLSQEAPPALGVKIHPLMFYDLDRSAAGAYGNESFRFLLDWAMAQRQRRRIIHYPEGSWWLTFDLPVPLYLAPVTLEARQHDLDLLAPHLSTHEAQTTGFFGHRLFTSGQEWGYWLIDYCVALMVWDLSFTHERCLEHVTGSLARGQVLREVLTEVERRQLSELRDRDIVRMLVGSDDETEAAARAGIPMHPLPPDPGEVLGWDNVRVAQFRAHSLDPVSRMAAGYHQLADRVAAVLPAQSDAQGPFVREIHDGLRVFALRAAHAAAVYDAALAIRAAVARGDETAGPALIAQVARARAMTDEARKVIRARERDYRYPPALTIAGDERGTPGALPNLTVYPYRYLSRTHRLFFWERPDRQLNDALARAFAGVRVSGRILKRGTPLELRMAHPEGARLHIDWGDGAVTTDKKSHEYAEGFHVWRLQLSSPRKTLRHEDQVAVVAERYEYGPGSFTIHAPSGAALIAKLLPGLVVGVGHDKSPFMALGTLEERGGRSVENNLVRRARQGMRSLAGDLSLPLARVGHLVLRNAVVALKPSPSHKSPPVEIRGDLVVDDVVTLLVGTGAFDVPGARKLIAPLLGASPEALPRQVSFHVTANPR
jgi:hypothetical protein